MPNPTKRQRRLLSWRSQMPDARPPIPTETQREVLFEARHRCAVCCFDLSLELAHVIPWRTSKDHRKENLIALCPNCHTTADNEKWTKKYFEKYKKKPCALEQNMMPPMTIEQKAMVDLFLSRNPDEMTGRERLRLMSMVAAFLEVEIKEMTV